MKRKEKRAFRSRSSANKIRRIGMTGGTPALSRAKGGRNNQRVRIEISKLRAHPSQGKIYESLSERDMQALMASMKSERLHHPVEVMPPGNRAKLHGYTIVDGHNRVEAARRLGWTHVDVVIRSDLIDADADTVEAAYLAANLLRRQLHPLDKAAALKRAYEIETRKFEEGMMSRREVGEAYDRFCAAAGLSGRHGKRLLNVLSTPRPIQRAVRDGLMSIVRADNISHLPKERQDEIADQIESLDEPTTETVAAIAVKFLGERKKRHVQIGIAFGAFARDLQKGLDDLDGRERPVMMETLESEEATLRRAHAWIGQQLARLDAANPDIVSDANSISANSDTHGRGQLSAARKSA